MADKIIFLLQITSTLFLTGVIWIIQIVQYPFFSYVGAENFTKYHDEYRFWVTPIVAPAMCIEFVTSVFLLVYRPENVGAPFLWFGLMLTLAIWASTFFLQIPLHEKLAAGFDAEAHKMLIGTNWIRTAAWSLRSLLMLYLIWMAVSFRS